MNKVQQRVENCVKQIREKTDFVPEVALILGSGLNKFAENIEKVFEIEYGDIEGFPVSTVSGHSGKLVFGYVNNEKVVCMQGRVHYYEGYTMEEVVLPTRVMALLGAKILFLTNAAGGLNTEFEPGDLVMIKDQINMFVPSPLIGPNIDDWGTRFPSMGNVYDKDLCDHIKKCAKEVDVNIKEGVYVQTSGPQYETDADVKMLQIVGADMVGMSTCVEAIVGNHMGMSVCGITCITNMAGTLQKQKLDHQEVKEIADKVTPLFTKLVWHIIDQA